MANPKPNYTQASGGMSAITASLTPSTRLTFDYQFMKNPGYNADRGPGQYLGRTRALAVVARQTACSHI